MSAVGNANLRSIFVDMGIYLLHELGAVRGRKRGGARPTSSGKQGCSDGVCVDEV